MRELPTPSGARSPGTAQPDALMTDQPRMKVYYNSACPVCKAGIEGQMEKGSSCEIQWADVHKDNALVSEVHAELEYVRERLHVVDRDERDREGRKDLGREPNLGSEQQTEPERQSASPDLPVDVLQNDQRNERPSGCGARSRICQTRPRFRRTGGSRRHSIQGARHRQNRMVGGGIRHRLRFSTRRRPLVRGESGGRESHSGRSANAYQQGFGGSHRMKVIFFLVRRQNRKQKNRNISRKDAKAAKK